MGTIRWSIQEKKQITWAHDLLFLLWFLQKSSKSDFGGHVNRLSDICLHCHVCVVLGDFCRRWCVMLTGHWQGLQLFIAIVWNCFTSCDCSLQLLLNSFVKLCCVPAVSWLSSPIADGSGVTHSASARQTPGWLTCYMEPEISFMLLGSIVFSPTYMRCCGSHSGPQNP